MYEKYFPNELPLNVNQMEIEEVVSLIEVEEDRLPLEVEEHRPLLVEAEEHRPLLVEVEEHRHLLVEAEEHRPLLVEVEEDRPLLEIEEDRPLAPPKKQSPLYLIGGLIASVPAAAGGSYLGFVVLGPLLAAVPLLAVAGPLLAGIVLGVVMSSVVFSVVNWGIPALLPKKNSLQEEPISGGNSFGFIQESLQSRTNPDDRAPTRTPESQLEQNRELENQDVIINLTHEVQEENNEFNEPGMSMGPRSM